MKKLSKEDLKLVNKANDDLANARNLLFAIKENDYGAAIGGAIRLLEQVESYIEENIMDELT